MSVSPEALEALADRVEVTETELIVDITDGRRVHVPLAWFPTLLNATVQQRDHWELLGDGEGIHWPELDADICVAGLLVGIRETYAST